MTEPLTVAPRKTREYACWAAMIQRCTNPNNPAWNRYGGRGIAICEQWRSSFAKFLEDMGPRPSDDHSIDRIDNNGNYEPGNCRWATTKEQNRPGGRRAGNMGGRRPGAGRPLTAEGPRDRVLHVYASEGEASVVAAAAERAGKAVSTFLLEAGLQRARRQR